MSIVLFGSTTSMIVEAEETCARLGLAILAIIKNVDDRDYALAPERIVRIEDVTPAIARCPYIAPIFTPGYRLAAQRDAARHGFATLATVVDPTAVVARSSHLEPGTYVNTGAVIGGASRIGASVFINRKASIGHHVDVGEFSSIGPGATIAGATRIGRGTVIGAGATVLPAVEIGNNTVVAAGAVVQESVGDHCLVVGNPGRIVKTDYAGYRGFTV